MPYDTTLVNRILGAARARDVAKVEELWLELQTEASPIGDLGVFFEIAREVAERGERDKAAELLLTLKEDLKGAAREDDLLELLCQAVAYSSRVRGVRDDLVTQFRRRYGARPGFEGVLSRAGLQSDGKLDEAVRAVQQAFAFDVGDFVFHARGWGVGKVAEARPEAGEFVVDFATRRGQRMEAGMAQSALQRRGPDDLDVLLWTDKGRVKTIADDDPLGMLRNAIVAAGGKLGVQELRGKLADVLDKNDWTKFWSRARKLAKSDPRIQIGNGPRAAITLREVPVARDDEVTEVLRRIASFEEYVEQARAEVVSASRESAEPPSWIAGAREGLRTRNRARAGTPAHQAARIEMALFDEEVARAWPKLLPDVVVTCDQVDPETGEPLPPRLGTQLREALAGLDATRLPRVLGATSLPDYRRRVVELVPALDPPGAIDLLRCVLLDPAPHTWEAAVMTLRAAGRNDVVDQACRQTVIKPENYPEAFVAVTRARFNGKLDVISERPLSELSAKAIQLLDDVTLRHKSANDKEEKRRLKAAIDLGRALLSEKNHRVLGQVIQEGTEDEVRRILQLVRQSPALTPTMCRAAENFVVSRFPELLATIVAAPRTDEEDLTLYSTLEGKRKREQELRHIMEVDLEAVRIEIGKALEFGDISENAELDAAREHQQRLAERAERIRRELEHVVLIDPATVHTDEVRVGTRVTVEHEDETAGEATYTILGPWDLDDADPTIVSHLSPLAQGLLRNRPGETATVRLPDGSRLRYVVKSIDKAILQRTT